MTYFWVKKEVSKWTSIRQIFGLVLAGESRRLRLGLSVKHADSCSFRVRK
nr:MAG TPA: hypothetical protein [Caudoviricetes sp.]